MSEAKPGMAHVPSATDETLLNPWVILLVDDEPQVHEITKLVLAGADFAGRPIEFHSAYSAVEAKTFLQRHPETALVLLDVVMETGDAGLGFVRYVRDQLKNVDLQIVLRTGQPGMAPERDVILKYEINGYFLKTEITAQKLYSIVVSALRAFHYVKSLQRPQQQLVQPGLGGGEPRYDLQQRLLQAIGNNEMYLFVQPEVALASGNIVGLEILPSWKTNDGIIGFSEIAEIVRAPELRAQFDEWLVRQACTWSRSWQHLRSLPVRVSVPLLGGLFADERMLSAVDTCLTDFGIAPNALDLEVPESILHQSEPVARSALAYLKSKRVSVTIVDFGSGLISLPMLHRLSPSRIKIHRSFVRNLSGDPERSAIARSIIALAHTFGLDIVADGIATDLDLQFLKWEGCDVGQGDILAQSMAVTDAAAFLEAKQVSTH
ncbi:MAG: EAL domain-containing response regulator [Burkholderiales bacterium]